MSVSRNRDVGNAAEQILLRQSKQNIIAGSAELDARLSTKYYRFESRFWIILLKTCNIPGIHYDTHPGNNL